MWELVKLYLGKMPDCITAFLALLHVWDLDLAEYVAMTQGVGGGGQGNLGEERNGCNNCYNYSCRCFHCKY